VLKTIDPLISPELLAAIARMGHGDVIAIVDRNYPAYAAGAPVVRADGSDTTEIARALFTLLPVDTFVEQPIARMLVVDAPDSTPPVHADFVAAAEAAEGRVIGVEGVERHDFYARARQASVVVATGETRGYGCFLVAKGVIG
jgi:L-fucose mutarotase